MIECLTGQLGGFDGNLSDTIQYCYNGEWRSICHQGSQWDTEIVRDVCRQLGFNSTGKF